MSQLEWTLSGNVWHAGRYVIELAAPRHWVLTETTPGARGVQEVSILATSGSLKALKADAEDIERSRQHKRRRVRYLTWFGVSTLVLVVSGNAAGEPWVPVILPVASCLLVWSLIKFFDASVARSWESLCGVYQ